VLAVGASSNAGSLCRGRGDAFTSEAYEYLGTASVPVLVVENDVTPGERLSVIELRPVERAVALFGCKIRVGRCDDTFCVGVDIGIPACCLEDSPGGCEAAFDKPT